MSPSYYVFLIFYIFSFIFVMNMDDWFLVWFGLELNMLSFLLLIFEQKSMFNVESCMKYFFVQSLGSAIFIGGLYLVESNIMVMGPLILVYSMGGGPFFFWFPSVCGGISWMSCFMLMSFQKFLPLLLLSEMFGGVLVFMMIVSLIVGVLGSFNQNKIKQLMAYSSIHQIGWLLMCICVDKFVWMIYYFVYIFVLFMLVVKLSAFEIINISSVSEMKYKWWMIFMMLNMGGMPPMFGFFLKWFGLYMFLKLNFFLIGLMIIMSVVMFYIYLRMCYNIFMGSAMKTGWANLMDLEGYEKYSIESFNMLMITGIVMGGFMVVVTFS